MPLRRLRLGEDAGRAGVAAHTALEPELGLEVGVVDRQLASGDTSGRYFWHRFNFDGYGEKKDGSPWDIGFPANPTEVWAPDFAPAGQPSFPLGEGTFSATPLAWSHAQFVRLAWSIDAGHPVEQPAIVAARYAGG